MWDLVGWFGNFLENFMKIGDIHQNWYTQLGNLMKNQDLWLVMLN